MLLGSSCLLTVCLPFSPGKHIALTDGAEEAKRMCVALLAVCGEREKKESQFSPPFFSPPPHSPTRACDADAAPEQWVEWSWAGSGGCGRPIFT